MNWLEYRLHNSTLLEWAIALAIALVSIAILLRVHGAIERRLRAYAETTSNGFDNLAAEVLAGTHVLFLLLIALYIGAQFLELPPRTGRVISNVVVVALLVQMAMWGQRAVSFWITETLRSKRATDGAGIVTVTALGFFIRVTLWSVIALMILDNIGVNVTALVASLGIGGVAVALAMQNILSDIFASLSITLDKPFVIGDFIVSGDTMGTVERIGLKTTRLRSISGEQVVLPNADLLKSRIHNHERMIERRVQFGFGVAPDMPLDRLERIPAIVRAVVEAQPKTRFERAHFKSFGQSTLDFEVVYFLQSPEYHLYMDTQQAVNLALLRSLGEAGVELAHPKRPPLPASATPTPAAATH